MSSSINNMIYLIQVDSATPTIKGLIKGLFRAHSPPTAIHIQQLNPNIFPSSTGYLLSGKQTQLQKITMFNGKFHYKWPFSIAMLNYRKVHFFAIFSGLILLSRSIRPKGLLSKWLLQARPLVLSENRVYYMYIHIYMCIYI